MTLRQILRKFWYKVDTDSVFIDFGITKNGVILEDKEGRKIGIKLGNASSDLINMILPLPQNLTYEKTLHPFVILSKKRYVGNLYENSPDSFKQKSMGIALKRRDFASIAKIVLGGIIQCVLNDPDLNKVIEFTKTTLKKIIYNEFPIEKFIISKTLRGSYADRQRIAHAVLADRMTKRDEGNKPSVNSRIPYVFIVVPNSVELQGDRIENPTYVKENNLRIDYAYYIEHQILKPCVQVLQHIIKDPEKIFQTCIYISENNKKGKRPIGYFFGGDNQDIQDQEEGIKYNDKIEVIEEEKKIRKAKQYNVVNVDKKIVMNGGFILEEDDDRVEVVPEKTVVKTKAKVKPSIVVDKKKVVNGGFAIEHDSSSEEEEVGEAIPVKVKPSTIVTKKK